MSGNFARSFGCRITLAGTVLAAVTSAPAASAQTVAEFYKDRQVTLTIGFNPGGGFDTYGRLVARHIGRHIPGQPTIVVKNRPGAGSVIAANSLYSTAPKDGTEIGLIAESVPLHPLYGLARTRFEALKFNWLGSVSRSTSICLVWHTSKTMTAKDLFDRETVIGTAGTSTIMFPLALNSVLGMRMKLVTGYRGTAGLMLALERGEIEGMCGSVYDAVKTRHPEWLAEKKVRVVIEIGGEKSGNFTNVPFAMDLAKSEDDRKVLNLILGPTIMGRPFMTPPDVPADRLAALKAAFTATMKDQAFLADARKLNIEVDPITGEHIERFVKGAYATPAPIVARARTIVESMRSANKEKGKKK